MEHKLDLVLRELQALRREAGKAHQGGPGIGPKGPFNPPTGPGGPGVGPGGFPPGGPGGGAPKPGFPGTPGGPPNPGADNVPAANPNPPAASVKGRITKIDKTDRTLVTISIGSDEGISTNNTLEVYRLQPTPQYLGRLLIRETRNHEAVGQLMKSSVQAGPLQEGDQVASSLQQ